MTAARYRCTACGNLTRFDVTESSTTRSYHHYSVAGELLVEDVEVLASEIADVRCRWCGTGSNVIAVGPDNSNASDDSTPLDDAGPENGTGSPADSPPAE